MINIFEVKETNEMIEKENLDVRTITLGISLLDCITDDLEKLRSNIFSKITGKAKDLVSVGKEIEREYGRLPPLLLSGLRPVNPRRIML